MSGDAERDAAVRELLGKSWGELEAVEHQGRLLFPSKIKRVRASGEVEEVPVMLRVPRDPEIRASRVEARELALRAKLDLDRDRDLVDSLESLVLLSKAIRNPSPPFYEPFVGEPFELEKQWDSDALGAVLAHLDALRAAIDPAPRDMTEEQTLEVLTKIAREGTISPLVGYGPSARARFIVSTARLLLSLLASRSSSESSGSPTPA